MITSNIDPSSAYVYAIPMRTKFRGITMREGMLIQGRVGWGEFCPFPEYDDREAAAWLATALEQANTGWPAPLRDRIPVNAIVPVVSPAKAHDLVAASGCRTAKVKVADEPGSLPGDLARMEAVRDALGPQGRIRIDANGKWDTETAIASIKQLDAAAGGLEYAEQPCASIEELALVRRKVNVPIAADESIRRAEDPLRVAVAGAADIAVIKCTPIGGVRRSLEVAAAAGMPCVVSSALETSIGLAAQVALAATLPELDFACGLDTLSLLDGDLATEEHVLRSAGGYLTVAPTPPTPSPAQLERFRHPDEERTRWWRQRLERTLALNTGGELG